MKGYKTTTCVICGTVHDTAANCPDHQAVCSGCKETIENVQVESSENPIS